MMQLRSRVIFVTTILIAVGFASLAKTSPTKTPPVAIGPKNLNGFGGIDGFHEFLTQSGSSAGDIGGIAAPDTYWVYITGIDASGVTGPAGREIRFNLQDSEDGSTFKHLGISISIAEPTADSKDLLECYQAVNGGDGVSRHILDPNNFSINQDTLGLRFRFTKTSSGAFWKIKPFFRINNGAWTLFTDQEFTATQAFDFLGAKLTVGFINKADGQIEFDNFFVVGPIRPPITTTYVDDDWLGMSPGDVVQFPAPGQFDVQIFDINAFATIQDGVDSLKANSALGTVKVAPGEYIENVEVDSLVHLIGSGNGDNPFIDTIVRPPSSGTSTITILGKPASGTSVNSRFKISDIRVTGASGADYASGSGILISVAADDTTRYLTFDNIVSSGNGCGIAFGNANAAFIDVEISNSTFDNNDDTGIFIDTNIDTFDILKIVNCDITNNGIFGITGGKTGASGVNNVEIDNTTFFGNGGISMPMLSKTAHKTGPELTIKTEGVPTSQGGDIHFIDFNGNASFTDVTVTGNNEFYGFQIRGINADGFFPAGMVSFTNVTVNGSFDEVNLDFGAGILIADYSDITKMSFSNVDLNVSATAGADSVSNLFFCQIDSNFSVADTDFGDTTPLDNAPFDIVNLALLAVDATNAAFFKGNPTPDDFEIEDRIIHAIDLWQQGLVTWVADNLFLTANSFVTGNDDAPTLQRAINAATPGNTINISPEIIMDGSPQLMIDRDLTIMGSGKTNTTLKPHEDTGSWIVVNDTVIVNIEKMTFDGIGFQILEAVRVEGQASFDSVCFNEFKFSNSDGVAILAVGDGPVNVSNSTFTEIGRVGALYADPDVVGSKFTNNTYTGKGDGNHIDIAVEITAGSIVEVSNCTISENRGTPGMAIKNVKGGGAGENSNLVPRLQSGPVFSTGILVSSLNNAGTAANIHDNRIFNSTTGIQVGISSGEDNFVTIKKDTLHDSVSGVLALSALFLGVENSQIYDDTLGIFLDDVTVFDIDLNSIYNNQNAIIVQNSFGEIDDNVIHSNTVSAIEIMDQVSATTTIHGNEFCNNEFGLDNLAFQSSTVDATLNWWGASDGPSGAGTGSGDSVSVGVDFSSFETQSIFLNSPCSADASCIANGDINNDNSLAPDDALCAFNAFLNAQVMTQDCESANFNCELEAADVNCDQFVGTDDALAIYNRFLNGMGPAECFAQQTLAKTAPAALLTLSQHLILQAAENSVEEELRLTISADNVDGLTNFGLNLQFPANRLKFLSVERTALTGGWTQLNAIQDKPGSLIVGGFNVAEQARPTSNEVLTLRFEVIDKVEQPMVFQVSKPVGDFANAVVSAIDNGISDEATIPEVFGLHQNFPNPFNPETLIRFDLPADIGDGVATRLNIYNITGQLVRTLLNEQRKPGAHSIRWDGRSDAGVKLSSGTYFYSIKAGDFKDTKKMILLK